MSSVSPGTTSLTTGTTVTSARTTLVATTGTFVCKLCVCSPTSDSIVVGVFGFMMMLAWLQQYRELRVHPWQAAGKDVSSAVSPKSPANAAVAFVVVLGSRTVAMPATHNFTTRGSKASRPVKQVSRVLFQ